MAAKGVLNAIESVEFVRSRVRSLQLHDLSCKVRSRRDTFASGSRVSRNALLLDIQLVDRTLRVSLASGVRAVVESRIGHGVHLPALWTCEVSEPFA